MDMKDIARARERALQQDLALRRKQRSLIASSAALSVALAGSLFAFVQLRLDRSKNANADDFVESIQKLRDQTKNINDLSARLAHDEYAIQALVNATGEVSHGGAAKFPQGLSAEDRQLLIDSKQASGELTQRVNSLESALIQTPDKALAVPLLKQQMLDIQDRSRGDAENTQGEINRLYGMMQWFLGLMITLIIGVAGLLISTFRQGSGRHQPLTAADDQSSLIVPKPPARRRR